MEKENKFKLKFEDKAGRRILGWFRNPAFRSYSGLIFVIIVIFIFMAFRSPNFLTTKNMLNVLRQVSVYGVLATGMAFAMMTGGIDLSVGSIAGVAGIIVARLLVESQVGLFTAVIAALAFGLLSGMINGVTISRTSIPPFIMTLGLQITLRGVAFLLCNGKPIGNLPDYLLNLGLGNFLSIPIPVYFMTFSFIVVGIILSSTSFGRLIYAVGGNYQAAYHSGINAKRVVTLAYTISGLMAALGGVLLAARNASAQPSAGLGFETEAIAACAMGGVAFSGGKGAVMGIFFGTLLMGIINNGMTLMYVSSYWQQVIKGLIIIGSVLYSIYAGRKK